MEKVYKRHIIRSGAAAVRGSISHVVENGSGIIKFKTRDDLISAPWQAVSEMRML